MIKVKGLSSDCDEVVPFKFDDWRHVLPICHKVSNFIEGYTRKYKNTNSEKIQFDISNLNSD
jgi:hypothetical protein